jgi:hypothetical protein
MWEIEYCKMNDDQLSDSDKKVALRLFAHLAWRLVQTVVLCYLLFFPLIYFGLYMDNIFPRFMAQSTRFALEEAQRKGILAFALEVLKTCSIALLICVGIFCWNSWKALEKISASSVEK